MGDSLPARVFIIPISQSPALPDLSADRSF
jgi:hypothetical protein